jgi:PAS domain S-box-containing protein
MNLPSRFSSLPFLRRRQPNLDEIETLIDHFPSASLLIDVQENRILLANAKATELTAFTRAEITKLELNTLFPELDAQDFSPVKKQNTRILTTKCITRNGNEFEVIIALNYLDSPGTWLFATLEPVVIHQLQQTERQRHSQRLAEFYSLAQACQANDLDQALQVALESGQKLIGPCHLSVYLNEANSPNLVRRFSFGDHADLPHQLSPSDINALRTPALWTPGKRSATNLHRAGRAARLTYVASAPLGEAHAIIGLLVAVGTITGAAPDLISILKVLAANITTIINHFTLSSHLLADQEGQSRRIAIGETIKENIQENIILLNDELKIIDLNPSAEWTLGYASREVHGEPVEDVLIGAENLIPALQSAQRGVSTHNLGTVRFHRRNGETFLAHVQILPVQSDSGQLIDDADKLDASSIVILIRDLSEHEQFRVRNQQLEQRALLGEVTAIFAHEVRNQINNISTGLQLLAMNMSEENPNQELISRLGGDLNRITHLMNSALAFSRPVENTMVPVDMSVLIHRLLERWRPRLARENIQQHVQVSTDYPVVMGDARTLEQVFTNLISNAVEAMRENGGALTIHIRTVKDVADRDQVELSVSDNGPGIPEEHRERIFDPFFSTSRNGTGLGLAIAKRIVTAHRGTIDVASVPGGTVFQVILPAAIKNND